jgi:hypothetical protein
MRASGWLLAALLAACVGVPHSFAQAPAPAAPAVPETAPVAPQDPAAVPLDATLDEAVAQDAALEDPELQSASAEDEPLGFSVSSPWPKIVNSGWWPAYADLTNRSEQVLEGTVLVTSWSRGRRIEVPFRIGPRQSTRLEIELPAFYTNSRGYSDSSYSLNAVVRGRSDIRIQESLQRDSAAGVHAVVVATPRALDGGIEATWAEQLRQASPAAGGGSSPRRPSGIPGTSASLPRPDLEISQVLYDDLPTRVAAYSSLELVILPNAKQLPGDERLAALLTWVRSGGRLALAGPDIVAAARKNAEFAAWLEPRFRVEGASDVSAVYACGLGWIGVSDRAGSLSPEATATIKSLLRQYPASAPAPVPGAMISHAEPRVATWSPAIPGLDEVPVRAFIAVLFLFWVLIGPVNFYIVSTRWKKPALLLVTIPALALLFSVLLFGYGIADQGLATRTAVHSLTLLDQRAHRANSVDVRQLFIGFSAGAGLRPGANTVVFPGLDAPDSNDDGYVIDAGPDGTLSGSFCPVRSAQILHVQSERSSRLRCELTRDGGSTRFRNGLESEIDALLVRDAAGDHWQATQRIAPGAEVELEAVPNPDLGRFYRERELGLLAVVPGSYIASVASNPFLDDCALEAREEVGTHTILGLLELGAGR